MSDNNIIMVYDEVVSILTEGQQGPPGREGVNTQLPAGTPVDAPVAAGDELFAAIYKLQGQSDMLDYALRGLAIVDMNGGNYTMTDDEAIVPIKAIINAAPGTELVWPTSSDGKIAPRQVIIMSYAGSNGIVFKQESSGFTLAAPDDQALVQLSHIPGALFFEHSRDETCINIPDTTLTVTYSMSGLAFDFTNPAGCAVTILPECEATGFWIRGFQMGAGQVVYSNATGIFNVDGHTKSGGVYSETCVRATKFGVLILSGRTGA